MAVPIFLCLLLMIGVGPALPWGRSDRGALRRALVRPIPAALAGLIVALLLAGPDPGLLLTGTFAVPNATVELIVDGEARKATASGVGPVDAVFKAVSDLVDTKAELVRYQVNAVTAGLDAQGEVSVTVADEGRKVIGHGSHTDVLVASAKAYVHALNKLEWHKERRGASEPKGI